MQDIVFYAAANETLGVVRDYANSRNEYAPTLVLGVSACLRMRLFAGSESAAPYPVASFSGITSWKWRMDSDFDRETPYKLNADSNGISVQTVTDTIDGETMSFTEFAIQISDMNTQELATWLGTEKKKTGLTGELVGYDNSGNAVFVLQIDDFTVRNRIAGLNEPTSNDQEYLTRSETEQLVQTEITSAAAAKQDKLTSANAGAGIAIDSGGTISMACVILGATNGVKIVNGAAQADPGDGLAVNDGKIGIDDASVADVLVGIGGGTASINDVVVTPGDLRGALSIGQAVDVSCAPYSNNGSISCTNDDFLQGFTCSMISGTTVGFYDATTHKFPKFATGLVYLFVADVSGAGTITPDGGSAVTLSETPQRITMKVTAKDTGYFSASAAATVSVANWRQYEVTALTDEAIAYLAQLPDPDVFFRSTSAASVVNKYLVKQDMVCPWIKTIGMPDNSDLTVAAGLSYKLKYTNDNAHKITVDTIPQDAYGWDAHIQMFVKGAAAVKFQPPLILMDALTPNAGHNLLVKFRNGDALVYVDDTDAGYIVVNTSGTSTGSLYDGLTYVDTAETGDRYIIFGATTDGSTCDAGIVTMAQSTDIVGNGTDKTIITGTYSVNCGKIVHMQDLTVSGSTLSGAGNIYLDKIGIDNDVVYTGTGELVPGILNVAANAALGNATNVAERLRIPNGAVWTGPGTVSGYVSPVTNASYRLSGITFTNCNGIKNLSGQAVTIDGCNITAIDTGDGVPYAVTAENGVMLAIEDSYMEAPNGAFYTAVNGQISVTGCTLCKAMCCTGNSMIRFYGTNKLLAKNASISDNAYLMLKTGSTLDLSEYSGYMVSGKTVIEDDVSIVTDRNITERIDGCIVNGIDATGALTAKTGADIVIAGSSVMPWSATNVIFASPLDASTASTVKLSGTTFTSASKIASEPLRVQLPASTTVSVRGNSATNGTDKIITAPIIIVGDNASAGPNGNATIEYGANHTSSISGLGTYIAKDGSNDFTANITSVTTANGLGTALAGSNRWVKVSNGLAASAVGSAVVVDKRIITNEYEPILGGTYTILTGGTMTVNESTKTATVTGSTMQLIDVDIADATVGVSGGGLAIGKVSGNNGTIELGSSNVIVSSGNTAYVGGCTITSGGHVQVNGSSFLSASDCVFSGNRTASGGALRVQGKINNVPASAFLTSCVISGNTGTVNGGGVTVDTMGELTISGCSIYGNGGNTRSPNIEVNTGKLTVSNGNTVGQVKLFNGAKVIIAGGNTIDEIIKYSDSNYGSVTVSSGASINLTSRIVPGGGVTLYGGTSLSPTAIICGGSSRIFEDVEIRGTTITDQGIIYGATVYSNAGDDHYVYYTGDGGATSSSVIVTGQTEYVVPGGLVRIVGT